MNNRDKLQIQAYERRIAQRKTEISNHIKYRYRFPFNSECPWNLSAEFANDTAINNLYNQIFVVIDRVLGYVPPTAPPRVEENRAVGKAYMLY
jgi:hypothetical protein